MQQTDDDERVRERQSRYWRGLRAEWLACVALICRGYWILAVRNKTPLGEIDIVARRGRLLVFVEVKARANSEDAEASVSQRQRDRIRRAADFWLARAPRYHDFEIRFDLVLVLPWAWPRHIESGL